MARRPHLVTPGSGARRAARLLLATSVLGLAVATAPLAAGADEGATATPTLAELLRGEVDGVTAEAATMPTSDGDMGVVVEVTNTGDDPIEVAVPFGTLLVTEEEADQTLAVTPPTSPEVIDVAARGETPTIEFGPGVSDQQLPAYCTELGDGYPYDAATVMPIDPAHAALAETLRNATVAGTDHTTTQDAVWWLTDEPSVPVPEQLHGLLEVDTDAFAASPHMVTPDTGYTPLWMQDEVVGEPRSMETPSPYDEEEASAIRDETFQGPAATGLGSDDGGLGAGPIVWAVLLGIVVITSIAIATRAGRATPATAVARTAPGWYPDPMGHGGHRYWDGRAWTNRTMGRR